MILPSEVGDYCTFRWLSAVTNAVTWEESCRAGLQQTTFGTRMDEDLESLRAAALASLMLAAAQKSAESSFTNNVHQSIMVMADNSRSRDRSLECNIRSLGDSVPRSQVPEVVHHHGRPSALVHPRRYDYSAGNTSAAITGGPWQPNASSQTGAAAKYVWKKPIPTARQHCCDSSDSKANLTVVSHPAVLQPQHELALASAAIPAPFAVPGSSAVHGAGPSVQWVVRPVSSLRKWQREAASTQEAKAAPSHRWHRELASSTAVVTRSDSSAPKTKSTVPGRFRRIESSSSEESDSGAESPLLQSDSSQSYVSSAEEDGEEAQPADPVELGAAAGGSYAATRTGPDALDVAGSPATSQPLAAESPSESANVLHGVPPVTDSSSNLPGQPPALPPAETLLTAAVSRQSSVSPTLSGVAPCMAVEANQHVPLAHPWEQQVGVGPRVSSAAVSSAGVCPLTSSVGVCPAVALRTAAQSPTSQCNSSRLGGSPPPLSCTSTSLPCPLNPGEVAAEAAQSSTFAGHARPRSSASPCDSASVPESLNLQEPASEPPKRCHTVLANSRSDRGARSEKRRHRVYRRQTGGQQSYVQDETCVGRPCASVRSRSNDADQQEACHPVQTCHTEQVPHPEQSLLPRDAAESARPLPPKRVRMGSTEPQRGHGTDFARLAQTSAWQESPLAAVPALQKSVVTVVGDKRVVVLGPVDDADRQQQKMEARRRKFGAAQATVPQQVCPVAAKDGPPAELARRAAATTSPATITTSDVTVGDAGCSVEPGQQAESKPRAATEEDGALELRGDQPPCSGRPLRYKDAVLNREGAAASAIPPVDGVNASSGGSAPRSSRNRVSIMSRLGQIVSSAEDDRQTRRTAAAATTADIVPAAASDRAEGNSVARRKRRAERLLRSGDPSDQDARPSAAGGAGELSAADHAVQRRRLSATAKGSCSSGSGSPVPRVCAPLKRESDVRTAEEELDERIRKIKEQNAAILKRKQIIEAEKKRMGF